MDSIVLKEVILNVYRGEINEVLDDMFGLIDLNPNLFSYEMKAFRYESGTFAGQTIIPIRIPGETIGGIWIDDNNIVTDVRLNSSTYHNIKCKNVSRIRDHIIGKRIYFQEMEEQNNE